MEFGGDLLVFENHALSTTFEKPNTFPLELTRNQVVLTTTDAILGCYI